MDFSSVKLFLDHLSSEYNPGNAIEVYLGGELVYRYASGYSDLEKKKVMTGEELFNIYSCTKIATVTAAMQLVEKGVLHLDDPLYAYIPEFRDMYVADSNGDLTKARNPISIDHLFTMTAGFNYDLTAPGFKKAREITDGAMDTVDTMRCIANQPLDFEPGTHWQYSICHDVLAAVVSVISGRKFREYVKENIFDPLRMEQSTFHHTEETLAQTATQYTYVENAPKTVDVVEAQKHGTGTDGYFRISDKANASFTLGPEYDSGGAGIITSVSDYAKFMAALANMGVGLTGERILTPDSVDALRTNRLPQALFGEWDEEWPHMRGYGYGLGVCTQMDPARSGIQSNIGEFGWGGAAGATAFADPSINLAVFFAQHTLNPREGYYQPRLKNAVYASLG